jgi:hypothetical protein
MKATESYSVQSLQREGEAGGAACDCTVWLAAGDFFVTLGDPHLHDGTKIDFIEDAAVPGRRFRDVAGQLGKRFGNRA